MMTAAAEWSKGRELWSVVHDSEQGRDHLATRGTPPSGWQNLREALPTFNGDVDHLYDLPLEAAKLVVGFRADSEEHDAPLDEVIPTKRPWYRFW